MAEPSGPYPARAERRRAAARGGRAPLRGSNPGPGTGGGRRVTPLMALGSAAILAVYTAGYARTEAAARELSGAPASVSQTGAASDTSALSSSSSSAASSSVAVTPPSVTAPVPRGDDDRERGYRRHHRGDDGRGLPPVTAPSTTAPAVAIPPVPSSTTAAPPPAAASSAPSATGGSAAAQSRYKDGAYTAVGYGRHGPIQATVVIRAGRIVSADITRCGTHYSCDVISNLVSEVVSSQAAPLDFVSGATDSSVAYQQAVSQALAQAGAA